MHTPSNLPSANGRGIHREVGTARLQSAGLFTRLPRKAASVSVPAPRAVPSFVCLAAEPEDAKLTGATRSLSRRLLALNIRQDS